MIVIVASEFDPHADAVILALAEFGFQDVFRIDLEQVQTRHRYSAHLNGQTNNFVAECREQNSRLDQLNTATVYWRRVHSGLLQDAWLVPSIDHLDRAEAYWAVRWALEALPDDRFPLSHPLVMHAAGNKLRQLQVAVAMDLPIPSSIVSNSPADITLFSRNFQRVVVKPLHALVATTATGESSTDRSYNLWSRVINSTELEAKLNKSSSTALFCQEHIDKVADIRLNMLPEVSVACRIDGSKLAPGIIDWRPTTIEHDHEIIEVPRQIEESCRAFLHQMNLKWGAFDFGVTRDGNWVFFECNPNGQWLWIQMQTRYPLAQEFARTLLSHHKNDRACSTGTI